MEELLPIAISMWIRYDTNTINRFNEDIRTENKLLKKFLPFKEQTEFEDNFLHM